MNLFRFASIKLSLFLVLGILIGDTFHIDILISVFGVFFGLITLRYLQIKHRAADSPYFGIVAMGTTLCIGILGISLTAPENSPRHYSNSDFQGTRAFHIKIREVLKPNGFSHRYIALVKGMDTKPVDGKVLVNLPRDSAKNPLHVDDELMLYSELKGIAAPLNPHQFNYRKYMQYLGIFHQLKTDRDSYVLKGNPSRSMYGIAANIRYRITQKLERYTIKPESLGIIQALILGQRTDLSTSVYDNYKNAGAVHILAVSGLHIGVLLFLLQYFLTPLERLPKGKVLKLVIIVALLWGFAVIAGLSASIIRAVAMFTFFAYALYLNRPSNNFNILALSLFAVLLIIDPKLLFQVGFQMSYAAVAAIMWIYPKLQRFWYPKNGLLRRLWQFLSVSVAAQLGVLPIALFYFHQFPGLFFVSNLLIVPFMGVILGMGILVILLALMDLLPDFLAIAYDRIIGGMNTVVAWVADQEAFISRDISFDGVQLILAYIIAISLVIALGKISFKRISLILLGIIALQLYSLFAVYRTRQKKVLVIAHQTRNSVLLYQNGQELKVFSTDSSRTDRLTTNYKIAERIRQIEHHSLAHTYLLGNQSLWILDSLGLYPSTGKSPEYVLFTQTPRLNLERFLDTVQPKQIIADGSNYQSSVKRWKATCAKRNVPFHYTATAGAYNLDLD
ncbi:MAG: ComEC/Rec2 family competence protein [Bacteroidota bacterium]